MAFCWGWSEATWFFVIPDVWLSLVALMGLRIALFCTLSAVSGALAGAITLYACPLPRLPQLWLALPGFRASMLEVARGHLAAGGAWGMEQGAPAGIPFRAYVWLCQQQGVPLASVLRVAPWVRLERMLFPPLLVWASFGLVKALCRRLHLSDMPLRAVMLVVIGLLWVAIYAYYWGFFIPRQFS